MKLKNFLINLLILPEGFFLNYLIIKFLPTIGYEMGQFILILASLFVTLVFFSRGILFVFGSDQIKARQQVLLNLVYNGALQIVCWLPKNGVGAGVLK